MPGLIRCSSSLRFPSPSMRDGLLPEEEANARAFGCHQIFAISQTLNISRTTASTACMILQRFYCSESLADHHPHFTSAACLSLACRLEGTATHPKDIIKQHLQYFGDELKPLLISGGIEPYLKALQRTEHTIQKVVGFSLVVREPWTIMDHYSSTHLNSCPESVNLAEFYLQVSFHTDLCARYELEVIVWACIFMAVGTSLPEMDCIRDAASTVRRMMEAKFDDVALLDSLKKCADEKLMKTATHSGPVEMDTSNSSDSDSD